MRDTLDLGRGRRKRRRWAWLAAPALAGILVLARSQWATAAAQAQRAVQWLDTAIAEHVAPGYTDRLLALQGRNAALHAMLAQAAPLVEENRALRAWLDSGATPEAGAWRPARLAAREPGGRFALACTPLPQAGAPVLDEAGRLAGVVSGLEGDLAWVDPAGQGAGQVPVLAGAECGVLCRDGDGLALTGLPRHCGLRAGDVVTTTGGSWVGVLARDPAPDAAGLTESAPLDDTAEDATVYFVA